MSVIDLRRLLLDQEECGVDNFTVQTTIDTMNLVEDLYEIGMYVMIGGKTFDYHRAEELILQEPPSRYPFLPYPRHVRGFVELNAYSAIQRWNNGNQ